MRPQVDDEVGGAAEGLLADVALFQRPRRGRVNQMRRGQGSPACQPLGDALLPPRHRLQHHVRHDDLARILDDGNNLVFLGDLSFCDVVCGADLTRANVLVREEQPQVVEDLSARSALEGVGGGVALGLLGDDGDVRFALALIVLVAATCHLPCVDVDAFRVRLPRRDAAHRLWPSRGFAALFINCRGIQIDKCQKIPK